jgi:hypothetical protein
MKHRYEPDLTKGLLAGAPAGVVASFLMEQFQSLWTGISKEVNPRADGSVSLNCAVLQRKIGAP